MKFISAIRKNWTHCFAIALVLLADIYIATKLLQFSQEDPAGAVLVTILLTLGNVIVIGASIALAGEFFLELIRTWGVFLKEVLPILIGVAAMMLADNYLGARGCSPVGCFFYFLVSIGVGLVAAIATDWLIFWFKRRRINNQDNQDG
jgi:hypothetical protein